MRPIYLNRVKSRGSCQAVTGAPPCWLVPDGSWKKGGENHQSYLRRGSDHLFGFCRATETWRGQSIDSAVVVGRSTEENREGLLNLKDLLTVLPPSCRATFSGCVGRLKRGAADLLISQGLLAKWLERTGGGLLNLKRLLTVFPPSLNGLFENEPVLRPLFCAESHQILPFSAKTWQNMAENRGFSRPILLERVEPCGLCQALAAAFLRFVGSEAGEESKVECCMSKSPDPRTCS